MNHSQWFKQSLQKQRKYDFWEDCPKYNAYKIRKFSIQHPGYGWERKSENIHKRDDGCNGKTGRLRIIIQDGTAENACNRQINDTILHVITCYNITKNIVIHAMLLPQIIIHFKNVKSDAMWIMVNDLNKVCRSNAYMIFEKTAQSTMDTKFENSQWYKTQATEEIEKVKTSTNEDWCNGKTGRQRIIIQDGTAENACNRQSDDTTSHVITWYNMITTYCDTCYVTTPNYHMFKNVKSDVTATWEKSKYSIIDNHS